MMLLIFCFLISISSARCVGVEEGLYLGMCEGYVTYPIWINDNNSAINNNFVIETWLTQIMKRITFDTVPIQCALTYPTCVNNRPVGICKSNCSSMFSYYTNGGYNYDPCSIRIFTDDSANGGTLCTKVLFSNASRIFVSIVGLMSLLFILI